MFAFNYIFILLMIRLHTTEGGLNPELFRDCQKSFNGTRVNAIVELPPFDTPPGLNGDDVAKIVGYLRAGTMKLQAPIVRAIQSLQPGLPIQQFWIVNRLAMRDITCMLATAISRMAGVSEVRRQGVFKIDKIGTANVHTNGIPNSVNQPQWGVTLIEASYVWNLERGRGVVVANIDSGVRVTHEALRGNYRGGQFSWLDAYTDTTVEGPNDGNGHGTHTMGSLCGQYGIGVAPDATWIACKGCNAAGECEEQPLLKCGQWIMCPYKRVRGRTIEDCTQRPKIVSNSWGGSNSAGSWYNIVIRRWRQAGIIPVFSIGNMGSGCGSAGSPGDQDNVISVGATDQDGNLADFSSRGPSQTTGRKKPEISAPGVGITSAWYSSDNAYATLDGTSMASPHAAGTIALLMAKIPDLTFQDVLTALSMTTLQPTGVPNWDSCNVENCSNDYCYNQESTYPNNGYGNGIIDALGAYDYF